MIRTIIMLMLSTFALSSGPSGCHQKQNAALPSPTPANTKPANVLKVLAEGFHSSITNPFVAVARDAETYAALTKLDTNLPKLEADFFKSRILIGAYLGERSTGGYGVDIAPGQPDGYKIDEVKPGKWDMVAQMITSPYKVVAIPVEGALPLRLSLDLAWRQKQQLYRLTSGSFKMTGGFAGVSEQFAPHGEVLVMRTGDLATFYFRLAGSSSGKERFLTDTATAAVQGADQITINRMSAGSFVNPPNAGLKAAGTFLAGGSKLSLAFSPLPSMIADDYQGQGSLEAEMVRSQPKP